MQTHAGKSPSLLLWIVTTAVLLSSTAGFAALMAWMPFLIGAPGDTLPASSVEAAKPVAAIDAAPFPVKEPARRKVKCRGCGLIASIREMEEYGKDIPGVAASRLGADARNGAPVRSASREITVRLEDGSSHVISEANPARWRLGERVIVIGSIDQLNR